MRELIDEVQCDSNGYVRLKLKGELIRCGECESWDTENSSGRKSLKNYRCACLEWSNLEDGYYVYTAEDEYCSRAERKDGEG